MEKRFDFSNKSSKIRSENYPNCNTIPIQAGSHSRACRRKQLFSEKMNNERLQTWRAEWWAAKWASWGSRSESNAESDT